MTIQYNSLPTYNELFLDYINKFEPLKEFYEYDYRSYEYFMKCIEIRKEAVEPDKSFFRSDLCSVLKRQNEKFNSSGKTFDNIKLLNERDTFAILTGQQLGFLTGPYYTILKAINAIQLSEKLNEKFTEYKFVPVFWLESDDHDFLEINNVNVISKENELLSVKYFEKDVESEKYLKPTGNIQLDSFINSFISKIEDNLNKTDFSEEIFKAIRNSYSEGTDIKTAFARFMNYLFGDKGLILIDPSDIEIKKFLKPLFEKELKTFPQVCETVINTSVELEKSYPAQIKPKAINLFYIHEGNRYLLEPRENEIFALKNSRQKFSKEELFELLEASPEKFSWNVVTRPVCQDYLFPTIAYIGGPSEISYFAQLKNVYKFFNVPMPIIYPRTSITIIENKVKNFLEKYNLQFEELFNEKELSKKLLKRLSVVSADQIFSDLTDELNGIFYTYEKELEKIDSNQTLSFAKRNKQFIESLSVAKDRYSESQTRQNEVLANQLKKVLLNIFPAENLQERVLNISYFLNKYSPDFIGQLFEKISPDIFSHQLIEAKSPAHVNN